MCADLDFQKEPKPSEDWHPTPSAPTPNLYQPRNHTRTHTSHYTPSGNTTMSDMTSNYLLLCYNKKSVFVVDNNNKEEQDKDKVYKDTL